MPRVSRWVRGEGLGRRFRRTGRPPARLSLVSLCLGCFMVILDATIVTVALPPIGREFDAGGGLSGVQWVADGYTVIFAALLLSAGSLGDRFGSRSVFLAGLALFVGTSAGCGLAPTLAFLIAMRLLQGAAAALVVPTSLALIRASCTDRAARARAIGVWGMIGGLAAASGPVLGGLLVAAQGWRAVFFVNLPIGLLGLAMTARYVRASPRPARTARPDVPAQVLAVAALGALAYGIIEAGHAGWTDPAVPGALAAFLLCGAAFVRVERRTADPMLPLGLFRDRTFSSANVIGFLLNVGFYGELFVVSFYFQQYRNHAVLTAGLAMLPQTAMVAVSSALGGRLTARRGPRTPMVLGLLTGAAGFLGLLAAGRHTPYPAVALPLAAIGFGTAFTMPAVVAAVVESAPEGRAGLASGALNASRQVGSAMGVAVLGALVARGPDDFAAGMRTGAWISAACFLTGAVLALADHAHGTRGEAARRT